MSPAASHPVENSLNFPVSRDVEGFRSLRKYIYLHKSHVSSIYINIIIMKCLPPKEDSMRGSYKKEHRFELPFLERLQFISSKRRSCTSNAVQVLRVNVIAFLSVPVLWHNFGYNLRTSVQLEGRKEGKKCWCRPSKMHVMCGNVLSDSLSTPHIFYILVLSTMSTL